MKNSSVLIRLAVRLLSAFFILCIYGHSLPVFGAFSTMDSGEENNRSAGRIGFSHMFATPDTPFWLHANRDGRIPLHSGRNLLKFGGYETSFLGNSDVLEGDAGFQLNARLSDVQHALYFENLYAHLRGYGLQLSAGRFYDTIGLHSGYLTTGSLLMSRNALQPFKLRLSTDGFQPVPLTRDYFSFHARWSESLLTDDRYVDNTCIHQKTFYLKLQPIKEVHLMGGIVHNLMWGGTHPERGRLHDSFDTWLRDIFAQPHEDSITPLGNGIGAYDFGAEYRGRSWSAGAYRMFYLEDRVSLRFRSPWDGMWGGFLHLHDEERPRRLLNYITYEHINTRKQDARPEDALGRAWYYSHFVWRDGWSHHGQVLGNPLLLIDPDKVGSGERIIVNSIILGHHVGLAGNFSENLSWELMATYSRNYGVCTDQTSGRSCFGSEEFPVQERDTYILFDELRRDRYSFMLKLGFPLDKVLDAVLPSGNGQSAAPSGSGQGVATSGSGQSVAPSGSGQGIASARSGQGVASSGKRQDIAPARHSQGRSISAASGYASTWGAEASDGSQKGLARGAQLYVSLALDAGEFHDKPLFGFEVGMRMQL